jgi:DNA-binding NtrC family response regulator
LLATELFGRDPQLGSGPVSGQIARAAGGTLVLDDVQELSDTLGRHIARVLEDEQFAPLGTLEAQPLTARVMTTATEMPTTLAHHFPIHIRILPLRMHAEDVAPLAAYFLHESSGGRTLQLDAEALSVLQAYEWPGNIRQLKHVMERVAAFVEGEVIGRRHLPAELFGQQERMPAIDTSETSLATVERRHIREVWRMTGGHISDTADLLGIHRNTLRRKLEEYGILE